MTCLLAVCTTAPLAEATVLVERLLSGRLLPLRGSLDAHSGASDLSGFADEEDEEGAAEPLPIDGRRDDDLNEGPEGGASLNDEANSLLNPPAEKSEVSTEKPDCSVLRLPV